MFPSSMAFSAQWKTIALMIIIATLGFTSAASIEHENNRTKRGILTDAIQLGCSVYVAIKDCSSLLNTCPSICDVIETICRPLSLFPLPEVCEPHNVPVMEGYVRDHILTVTVSRRADAEYGLQNLGKAADTRLKCTFHRIKSFFSRAFTSVKSWFWGMFGR